MDNAVTGNAAKPFDHPKMKDLSMTRPKLSVLEVPWEFQVSI